MKSFLIGSLPHTILEEALDYSFAFDIPSLPTLPKIDADEFMVDQALREIDGHEYVRHGLRDKNVVYHSPLKFLAQETFFERLQGDYKWQASGPLTLASCLDHHPKTEEVLEKYFQKLLLTQSIFNSLASGKKFFFLDEPTLAFFEERFEVLESFLLKLKQSEAFKGAVFGLHVCSKAGLSALKRLSFDLYALDPSLYEKREWRFIQQELGEKLVYVPVSSKGEKIDYSPNYELYASSSCGLALTQADRLFSVRSSLERKL